MNINSCVTGARVCKLELKQNIELDERDKTYKFIRLKAGMVLSAIEKIIENLMIKFNFLNFKKEVNPIIHQEGANNIVVVADKAQLSDKFSELLERKNNSLVNIYSQKQEMISEIKKEMLVGTNLSIFDMIEKAYVLACLTKDEKHIKWLEHELNGYPDNYRGTQPAYRHVKVSLNIGITSNSGQLILDLRERPLDIILGIGLIKFKEFINQVDGYITFSGPLSKNMIDAFKIFKTSMSKNFDFDKAPYMMSKPQLNEFVDGLRKEIIRYVSSL